MNATIGVWAGSHPHSQGHLQALENAPEAANLLVYSDDTDTRDRICARIDKARPVSSPDRIIDEAAVDALVVLLPTDEAYDVTVRAIEQGVYVYGDKPGAPTAAQMNQLANTTEDTGAHFCPAYLWRTDPVAVEIRAHITDGALGRIWSFDAKWLTSQVVLRDPSHWLFHKRTAGAGILSWLACHWIDLTRFVLGDISDLAAMVATQSDEDIDVEDTASVILQLHSGAIGTVRAGYVHKPFLGYDDSDLYLSFQGQLGSIYWPPKSDRYLLRTGHPDYRGVPARWIDIQRAAEPHHSGYGSELLRAFIHAAVRRQKPPVTQHDALRVLQVVEAAIRSSKTGRHVQL